MASRKKVSRKNAHKKVDTILAPVMAPKTHPVHHHSDNHPHPRHEQLDHPVNHAANHHPGHSLLPQEKTNPWIYILAIACIVSIVLIVYLVIVNTAPGAAATNIAGSQDKTGLAIAVDNAAAQQADTASQTASTPAPNDNVGFYKTYTKEDPKNAYAYMRDNPKQ